MERLSQANLRPAKSWKGNLNGPLGQSTVWRTPEGKETSESSFLSNFYNSKYFPGVELSSLKKHVIDWKYNSSYGTYWDILQVLFSILSCGIFVSETYIASYTAVRRYNMIEQIITQFFAVDFFLSWFVSVRTSTYFSSPMTWVDLITILPSYLIYLQNTPDLSVLRFVRILRLIRILRTFRLLGGFSGVKKQMITICLLILSLTFLAAGIYNLCENDFNQFSYDCKYINSDTNYEPSCSQSHSNYDDPTCDCQEHDCAGRYLPGDNEGQPSIIRCTNIGFLESYYFTVVTICSVGYGDFSPTNQAARVIMMIYIATAFIMIPIQINKLEQLMTMNSRFRSSYEARSQENHIILCGHVNDKQKLSRFFREFFHPDRQIDRDIEINICILCPSEPNDEVKDLLASPLFDNRVSYVIGSALNMEDLQKARGDLACAMFFLSNIEVDEEDAILDDAASVLRTLSVNNFNYKLDCYVQVLRSQERDLLKESNAELILCYDEYKTILQARNAVCPGLATMIENLFHTFGSIKLETSTSKISNDWLSEYSYGARMEIYYIPIDLVFFGILGYAWQLLVEAIYLEFQCLLVGVCNLTELSAHFNPRAYERKKYQTLESYFQHYSLGLLLAPNNSIATAVRYALSDTLQMETMIGKLHAEEEQFMVRRAPDDGPIQPPIGTFLSASARALSVGRSFRSRSVRHIDVESLNTEHITNLKKIQFALDNEFLISRNMAIGRDLEVAMESTNGMESDSSEDNEDDFLGYIEQGDSDNEMGQRRVGIYDSTSLSSDLIKNLSESGEINTATPVKSSGINLFTQSFSPKKTNVDSSSSTSINSNIISTLPPLQPSQSSQSSQPSQPPRTEDTQLLDSLDDYQENKSLRPKPGMVSLKSIQNMKRAASSRKMSSLKSFRNNLNKKNKIKSLKQAASLIKTVNKLNAGGAGGFAALVKAAALATPTPDNLVAKPASISTALQQTRTTKQSTKLSLFDAVKLANVKESIATNTTTPNDEERSFTHDLLKFQTIKEEELKSSRISISTRTSSCYVVDNMEGLIGTTTTAGGIRGSTSTSTATATAAAAAVAASSSSSGDGGGLTTNDTLIHSPNTILKLKSQKSLGRKLSRSQSKSLARAQSRGAIGGLLNKQLSRGDSSAGEIMTTIPSTTNERNSTLRRSTQIGFNKTRRPSVDSGLSMLTNNNNTKGKPSVEIEDASHLKNHIIVFGCMDYIYTFIIELRKKLLYDNDYRSILIVAPQEPRKWYQIRVKYHDIYYLSGTVTTVQDLILLNIRDAHALVLLAHRQAISVDETSNIDSESLFLYITIETHVPKNVFFTVELCRPNNMGVLNSVIMRRNKSEKSAIPQPKNMTAVATALYGNDAAGTGLSLKLRGSHKFRGSVDIGSMMTRLQSEKSIDEKSVIKLASRRANVFNVPDLSGAPTRSMSISSMISSNPALHSKNQAARRKLRASRKIHAINFWDVDDTHHVLPVYASGKAICPTAFDTILCQSFFGALTSQLCEKLVGGQETQTIFQFSIPRPFFGRKYVDLFRACVSRSLLPFGLYRSPLPKNGAVLSYVYTNPPMETILAGQDKIFLFGNPQTATTAFQQFEIALDRRDGKTSLGAQVSIDSFHERKRKSVVGLDKKLSSRFNANSEYQPLGGGGGAGGMKKSTTPSSTLNSNAHSEYQPKVGVSGGGGGAGAAGGMKKSTSPISNTNPNSEYQPLGGTGMKKSTSPNSNPNVNSEYQPLGGGIKNKPPAMTPKSDYQPMGAKQKSFTTENKLPTQFQPSQYVPRGAARIHPNSQTPMNETKKDEG